MFLNSSQKINKIEILNCNNNCLFCNIKKRSQLNTKEIKELIKNNKKDNDILHFGNGEVAIRPDFIDLINFGKQLGYQIIEIETNGRIFYYPGFIEKIKYVGIDKYIIEFHSHKKEIHDLITNAINSFVQTVGGIKNLIKNHKYVAINLMINKYNQNDLLEIVEFLSNLKINEINFQMLLGFNFENDETIKKAVSICRNYRILTNVNNLEEFEQSDKYSENEKHIKEKIEYLVKNNIKFIDLNLRKEIFKGIKLLEILEFLRKKEGVLFHSSREKFVKLVPHQGNALYHHGNFMAVYAQDDPSEAILRALKNSSGLCAAKKVDNGYRFFAEKKNRENVSTGYIHLLINEKFFYSSREFYTFLSVSPVLVFEARKQDLPYEIEPYPFYEVSRSKKIGLFADYERDLIRELCLSHYSVFKDKVNIKMHGFEHIYRVSEIAFNFALKECPDFANDIFIGACLHDIGRDNNDFDKNHGIKRMLVIKQLINKYFKDYYNPDVIWAIKYHNKDIISKNSVIKCLLDADRIDLLRYKIIPKDNLLSTQSAKEMMRNISLACQNNFNIIFENWDCHLDYFRKFIDVAKFTPPNKFFQKVDLKQYEKLVKLLQDNYEQLGEIVEIYKYTKHSCNKIHLFVFTNKKVIIKFSDQTENQIVFENYLIDLMKDKINLSKIIKTINNKLFIIYKNRKIILSEYVEGRDINFETLEIDVIDLIKAAYKKRKLIAKMYKKLLTNEYKNKIRFDLGKGLQLIKNKKIKDCLKINLKLIEEVYMKGDLTPVFKGLQVVGSGKNNCFLGTEHLFELYVPINQAIANYIVNLIFLSKKEYSIDDINNLIKKFLTNLEITDFYQNAKLVILFFYFQYLKFLENEKLEDRNYKQKWRNLLLKINKLFNLYQ